MLRESGNPSFLMLVVGYSASALGAIIIGVMIVAPELLVATMAPVSLSGTVAFVSVNAFLLAFWLWMLVDHLSHRLRGSSRLSTAALALMGYPAALVYFWLVVAGRSARSGSSLAEKSST